MHLLGFTCSKNQGSLELKFVVLIESKTFYTSRLEAYIPNQIERPFNLGNYTHEVVNRLVTGIENTGRNVICDNLF